MTNINAGDVRLQVIGEYGGTIRASGVRRQIIVGIPPALVPIHVGDVRRQVIGAHGGTIRAGDVRRQAIVIPIVLASDIRRQIIGLPMGIARAADLRVQVITVPVPIIDINLDSKIKDVLTFETLNGGTIESLTNVRGGQNYVTPPFVSIIQRDISIQQIDDGFGGIVGDVLGAAAQISESFVLLLFASGLHF